MLLFLFVAVYITVCGAIVIRNRTEWEVRQSINALGVQAPNAATKGELPFLVIVMDERVVLCNGVIVTYEFVLVHALCMKPAFYTQENGNISEINVLAGVQDTTDPKIDDFQWLPASDIITDSTHDPHLVLIKLETGLKLTGLISGIALPREPFKGTQHCFLAGYIFKISIRPFYHRKQVVDVYGTEECMKRLQLNDHDKIQNSICLILNTTIANNTMDWDCQADDGRFAFCEKTLVGFIEGTYEANCTNSTTFFFTDVGRYYDFFYKEMLFGFDKDYFMDRSGSRYRIRQNKTSSMFSYFSNFLFILSLTIQYIKMVFF